MTEPKPTQNPGPWGSSAGVNSNPYPIEKTIVSTVHDTLVYHEDEVEIELVHVYYPLAGYGNNVTTRLRINKYNGCITVGEVRINWNGTGGKELVYLCLDKDLADKLVEKMRKVGDLKDFEKLYEELSNIQDDISNRIDEAYQNLLEQLYAMETYADILQILRDKERLIAILREYMGND